MRRYMGTDEDRERIKKLLNKEAVGWRKERLVALKMGFQPHHSIDEIGAIVGRGKATIQRWFDKYRAAGLGAVLTRAYGGAYTRLQRRDQKPLRQRGGGLLAQWFEGRALEHSRSGGARAGATFRALLRLQDGVAMAKKMRRGASSPSPRA